MHLDAPYREGRGDGAGESGGHGAEQRRGNGRYGNDDDDPAGPAGVGLTVTDDEPLGTPVRGSRLALRRRRQVFFGLLVMLAGSLAAALLMGTMTAWIVHGGIAALFVVYVTLLVRHHRRVVEQVAKVRYLAAGTRIQRPAVVVVRSGTASGAR